MKHFNSLAKIPRDIYEHLWTAGKYGFDQAVLVSLCFQIRSLFIFWNWNLDNPVVALHHQFSDTRMTVRFAIWPWKPGQMSAWLQGNVVHRHFLRSKVNEHVSWYSWDFSSSAGFRNWVGNEDQLLVSHITYPYLWTRTKISQEVVVLYIGVVSRLWVGTLTMHFARQTLPTNVPRRVWHFTDRDRTHRRQGHTRVNPGPENQPQNRSALFFHTLYTFIWLVVSNMFFFP